MSYIWTNQSWGCANDPGGWPVQPIRDPSPLWHITASWVPDGNMTPNNVKNGYILNTFAWSLLVCLQCRSLNKILSSWAQCALEFIQLAAKLKRSAPAHPAWTADCLHTICRVTISWFERSFNRDVSLIGLLSWSQPENLSWANHAPTLSSRVELFSQLITENQDWTSNSRSHLSRNWIFHDMNQLSHLTYFQIYQNYKNHREFSCIKQHSKDLFLITYNNNVSKFSASFFPIWESEYQFISMSRTSKSDRELAWVFAVQLHETLTQ